MQPSLGSPEDRGAEAAFRPEWPVHIAAEPHDRGREAVRRVAAEVEQLSLSGEKPKSHGPSSSRPCPEGVRLQAPFNSLEKAREAGATASRSAQYTLQVNPADKTKPQVHTPAFPSPPLPCPWVGSGRGNWDTSDSAARLAASGYKIVVPETHSAGKRILNLCNVVI